MAVKPAPVTREEFDALVARVAALEAANPNEGATRKPMSVDVAVERFGRATNIRLKGTITEEG